MRDAACPLSTFLSRSTYSAGVDGAYARRRWGHRGRDHCPRDQEGAPLLSPYQCPYRCCRHPVDFSRPLLTLPLLLPLPWRGVPGRRVSTRGPRVLPRGESRVLPRDQSRVLPRDRARRGRAWFRRPSTSRRRTPSATSTTRSRRAARHASPPSRTKWTRRVPQPVLIGHAALPATPPHPAPPACGSGCGRPEARSERRGFENALCSTAFTRWTHAPHS